MGRVAEMVAGRWVLKQGSSLGARGRHALSGTSRLMPTAAMPRQLGAARVRRAVVGIQNRTRIACWEPIIETRVGGRASYSWAALPMNYIIDKAHPPAWFQYRPADLQVVEQRLLGLTPWHLQLDFPGNEGDADVSGPWAIGTGMIHVLARWTDSRFETACFWEL